MSTYSPFALRRQAALLLTVLLLGISMPAAIGQTGTGAVSGSASGVNEMIDSLSRIPPRLLDNSFFRRAETMIRVVGKPDASTPLRLALAEHLLFKRSLPDSAATILQPLVDALDVGEASAEAARAFQLLGQIRYYQLQMPEALECQERAVAIFEELGLMDEPDYANAQRMAAELSGRIGDFNQSILYYRKAIRLFETQRDTAAYFYTIHNLAQLFGVNGFYELAEQERELVFEYAEKRGESLVACLAHLVACIEQMKLRNFPEMLAHLQAAGVLLEALEYNSELVYYFHRFNLAYAYVTEDQEHAEVHFWALREVFSDLQENARFQYTFLRDEATYHYIVGNYSTASRFIDQAYAKLDKATDHQEKVVCYELLRRINKALGKEGKALFFAEKEAALRDTMNNAIKLTQAAYYENLYEKGREAVRKAEQQAALEKITLLNQSRVRIAVFIAILVLLFAVALHLYRNFRFTKREKETQQQYSQDLLLTQEREQRRIGRDLHDVVGQELLLLHRAAAKLPAPELAGGMKTVFRQVRDISHKLYTPGPERLGFMVAMEQLIDRYDRTTELFFTTQLDEAADQLPQAHQNQLFAILRESLHNIDKHAQAEAVAIKLIKSGSEWYLTIMDNGVGFSKDQPGQGIGLRTMKERAAILGGRLNINSEPGEKTIVTVKFSL